jgi:RNA recognition motif-containing protein
MRGQAFVIYRDINSAMEAKRKLNSKELYGKTMVILLAIFSAVILHVKSLMSFPKLMALSKSDKNLKTISK